VAQLILRIVINAIALTAAAYLIPGIEVTSDVVQLLLVAVVFGLVNALIKPIVSLLSCPLTLMTLGLFTLVVNALMLMLTDALVDGIAVDGFFPALLGALVISIVSTILSAVLISKD
jgi:putative membrane protein